MAVGKTTLIKQQQNTTFGFSNYKAVQKNCDHQRYNTGNLSDH